MAYATSADVIAGFRELDADELSRCNALLDEAAVMIDTLGSTAEETEKALVSVRMVRRALGDSQNLPIGATQGSIAAGGYSQSWTIGSNGSSGELYISRIERRMLGLGNRIGSYSPVEELVHDQGD